MKSLTSLSDITSNTFSNMYPEISIEVHMKHGVVSNTLFNIIQRYTWFLPQSPNKYTGRYLHKNSTQCRTVSRRCFLRMIHQYLFMRSLGYKPVQSKTFCMQVSGCLVSNRWMSASQDTPCSESCNVAEWFCVISSWTVNVYGTNPRR